MMRFCDVWCARITLAVALATAVVVACGGSNSTPGEVAGARLVGVKLQLNWKPEPQFGGFFAAEIIGAYERHGLNVEVNPGGKGAPTIEMVGAGTVPFGIVSGDEIVRARAAGVPVVGLFAVYQTNPQGIMTRASRGFQSIADVFSGGGTLAIERGLPYADFLEKRYGFGGIKVVPSPFGDLSLFRSDDRYSMQCFVTSEPLAAAKIGVSPRAFLIAEAGYNPYATVLATNESYLNDHREQVAAMVLAVREGWQAYLANPLAANDVMGKLNPTMSPETFAESALAQLPLIVGDPANVEILGSMSLERWRNLVDQLLELGAINKPVAPQQCFVDMLAG